MYPFHPSIYGFRNTVLDPNQSDILSMTLPVDSRSSPKSISKSIVNNSMSQLAQSASVIQGQMAASQIPLCIVQDPNGQLHQLVYMVPEHLYQSYITAASKEMKVNLPPKLDRFNAFVSGGESSRNDTLLKTSLVSGLKTTSNNIAEKTSKSPHPTDKEDKNASCRKNKKLKSTLAATTVASGTNTSNNKQLSETGNQLKEKAPKDSKSEHSANKATAPSELVVNSSNDQSLKSSNKPITHTVKIQRSPSVSEARPFNPNQIVCDPFITKFYSLSNYPTNATKEAHFVTKELLPLLTKNDLFIKNSKQLENLKKESNAKKSMNINKESDQPKENHIDLTINTTTSKGCKSNLTKDKTHTTSDVNLSNESKFNNQRKFQQAANVKERNTSLDKEKTKHLSKSTIVYPESIETTNRDNVSIDAILSQNNSDLIPKSDVESLLKCLKRKLEEKEDAERSKRAKNGSAEVESDIPTRAHLFTDEPGELFSSFDGSPESEQADSPNLYFQSRDMGSVSSVDSALSYNQQSSVSSDNSDLNANSFNFLDEILADDSKTQVTPNAIEKKVAEIVHEDSKCSNEFASDVGLVNTLHNQTEDNIDFSFLDNIKDNYLECDNIFDSTASESTAKEKSTKSASFTLSENISFPTQHSSEEVDLFDHLWNELDNL